MQLKKIIELMSKTEKQNLSWGISGRTEFLEFDLETPIHLIKEYQLNRLLYVNRIGPVTLDRLKMLMSQFVNID